MDKSIIMEDGERIDFLEKDPNYYLYKSITIYGGAQSGKTIIMDEILYLLRNHIPVVFAVSPTNSSTNTFTDKIPSRCIMSDLSISWLENFISRQIHLTEIYKLTQNMKIIKPLFDKVATIQERRCFDVYDVRYKQYVSNVEHNANYTFAQKKASKNLLKLNHKENVIKLCKEVIYQNRNTLIKTKLNKQEKAVVKMININPNALLIFDDCASCFKRWFKKTDLFKKMFYNIRWMSLTLIITSQDDKDIDAELRKNSMVSVFTTHQVATANFTRSSNGYSREERRIADMAIKAVFSQKKGEPPHYQKLCYLRTEANPFRYTIADIYEDFKVGIRELWENEEDETLTSDNPYLV